MTCAALLLLSLSSAAPVEVVGEAAEIRLQVGSPLVLRTKVDVYRTAVAAEGIVELSQFTPREISLVGRRAGTTTVTLWFRDPAQPPANYAVKVVAPPTP